MQRPFSQRASRLEPSGTFAVVAKVQQIRAKGDAVFDFGAGQPDFDTPDHIKEAAIVALKGGDTKYTATSGKPELRKAVAQWTSAKGYDVTPANVIVTVGGKHALFNALCAILDEGDEVIIPAPYYVSITEIVSLCAGVSVVVKCPAETDFKMSPAQLQKALSAKTRAVYLNSPSNPAGTVYSADELRALLNVLRDYPEVYVIYDELYEKIVFEPSKYHSLGALVPEFAERLITVGGVSKSFAMTGWRIGWAIANQGLVDMMERIQSSVTSNATSFAMAGAIAALKGPFDYIDTWNAAYLERRGRTVDLLNRVAGVKCRTPQGAFYCFPAIPDHGPWQKAPAGQKSIEFTNWALDVAHVAVVPGVFFGMDDHFRVSFATSIKSIEEGLEALRVAVDRL